MLSAQSRGNNNLLYLRALVQQSVFDFLVDLGASHSYIPSSFVQALGLDVVDCIASDVKLPNGSVMTAKQYVRLKVTYAPSKFKEVIKFYILPIGGTCILGGDWLRGNKVALDYDKFLLQY